MRPSLCGGLFFVPRNKQTRVTLFFVGCPLVSDGLFFDRPGRREARVSPFAQLSRNTIEKLSQSSFTGKFGCFL
jgi:hypothetical protein